MDLKLYGPLTLRCEDLNYEIVGIEDSDIPQLNDYLAEYSLDKNILENSFYTRIVKIDLISSKPIIGLIVITENNYTYKISHLSILTYFRYQNLARMLLLSFIGFVKNKKNIIYIGCEINEKDENLVGFFRNLRFNEIPVINNANINFIKELSVLEEEILQL